MGQTKLFGLKALLLFQIIHLIHAAVKFNPDASKAYQDVAKGTKRSALFKPSADLSTVSLVKVSDDDFSVMATNILASKENVVAAYSNDGKSGKELFVLVWIPSGNSDEVSKKYSAFIDELEKLFGTEIVLSLISDLDTDFKLPHLLENAAEGYNRIITSQSEIESEEVITVNIQLQSSIQQIFSGSKRYVIFKFSDDFSSLVLEKTADLSATFADLTTDLKKYETSGDVRIVLYFLPVTEKGATANKMLLILWAPSKADKSIVTKYETRLKSLKTSLKIPIWNDVTLKSSTEVTAEGINKVIPAGSGQISTKDLGSDVINVDAKVQLLFKDLAAGLKRYFILKFSDDFSSLSPEKDAEIGNGFVELASYLKQYENSGQLRIIVYLAPISKDSKVENKLLLLLWIPASADKTLATKFENKVKLLKVANDIPLWNKVIVKSTKELTNENINKQLPANSGQLVEEINVDAKVQLLFKDLAAGLKRYFILKFSDDFSSLSPEKDAEIGNGFVELASYLKQYENSGQLRIIVYLAPISKDSKVENKLLLLLWIPASADKTLATKFENKVKLLKVANDIPLWNKVIVKSTKELTNENINKQLPANSGQLVEEINVDAKVQLLFKDLAAGLKRYFILKFSDDFSSLSPEKDVDIGNGFVELASYLKQYENSGQLRIIVYLAPISKDSKVENKLLLLLWIPDSADKTLATKFENKVKLLKAANDIPLWNKVIVKSTKELTIENINKQLPANSGQIQQVVEEPQEEISEEDDDEPADLDKNVDSVVEEVNKGTKKYVVLKWTPKKTLVVDKVGAPTAKYDDLVKDLQAVEKTGEGRYAFFNDNNKLTLIVWVPSSLNDEQKKLYKTKFVKLKKLLKKNFLFVVTKNVQDLDLSKVTKVVKTFDYQTWLTKFGKKPETTEPEEEISEEDDNEPADLDKNVDSVVEEVNKGTKKYVVLKWTPKKTLVVDKVGAPTAKYDDLVKDLQAVEKTGEGRYAFFNDNNKLTLIVWVPSSLNDEQKKLYKTKFVKLKKLLKKNFLFVVTKNVQDLDLSKVTKVVKTFDYQTWLTKFGKKPETTEPEEEISEEDDNEPADLDKNVDSVVEEVNKGTKKYVVLKWTPKKTLVVDKVGAPTAKYDDLVKDLQAVEKTGEGRYAFFNDNNKLTLIVWVPSSLNDEQKKLYKTKFVKLKKLLKKNFLFVVTKNVQDLDLSKVTKVVKTFDYQTWLTKFGKKPETTEPEEEISEEDDNEPADLDKNVDSVVEEVNKGTKKYVVLKWTPKKTLVVDKVGAPTAKYDDLVKDLQAVEKTGEGRYAFFNDNNKLTLIVWVPSSLNDEQKKLYKTKFVKLKKLLKKNFLFVVTKNVQDLDLSKVTKVVKTFDYQTWLTKFGKKPETTEPEEEISEEDDNEPADLDKNVDSVVEEVNKGTKKYVVLKWTPKKTLVVDKVGAPTAKYDDLVKDLQAVEKTGEGRYAFFNDNNKLTLIVWVPSSLNDEQKKLYKTKFVKLKKLLKKNFLFVVTKNVQDLDLSKVTKVVKTFDYQTWLTKFGKKPETTEPEEEISEEDDNEPADLDKNVDSVVEEVNKGTKKYVVLKWTPKKTLVVDKVGAPTAKYDDLVKDLQAVEKTGEGRYAFFNDNNKLTLIVWVPSSLNDEQKKLYKTKFVKLKKLLKKNFLFVVTKNVQDLDLSKVTKVVKTFDYQTWLTKFGKKPETTEPEEEISEEDDNEPADLDKNVDSVVEEVNKGTKKYVVLKWTPKKTLVVDKVGAPTAKYDDLVKDLQAVEKTGEGRYAFFNDNNKLTLIVWVPSSLNDEQKKLYKTKFVKLKKLLKKNFLFVVTKNVQDLDLSKVTKVVKTFDYQTWLTKFGKKPETTVDDGSDYDSSDEESADLDKNVDSVVEDVKKGAKKYAILKWTKTSVLVVDKTGGPGAKFDDLVKDLVAVEKSGEGRYAFFNDNDKLVLIVWVPSSLPEAQKVLYKKKLRKFKRLLKKSFFYVIPNSATELNLDSLLKLTKFFDFISFFKNYSWSHHVVFHGGSEDESGDDDESVTLDSNVNAAVDEVSLGKRKYITLKVTSSNSLVVDKSGGPGAKFEDLVKDLSAAQKSGEGRFAFYYDSDKKQLLFLIWIPSDIPEAQQTLYRRRFRKLKKLLKKSFSYVVIKSSGNLDLNWILKSLKSFDFDTFFSQLGWKKFGGTDFGKDGWQKFEGKDGESGWQKFEEKGDVGGWSKYQTKESGWSNFKGKGSVEGGWSTYEQKGGGDEGWKNLRQ